MNRKSKIINPRRKTRKFLMFAIFTAFAGFGHISPSAAFSPSSGEENVFNYNANPEDYNIEKQAVSIDYSNVEIIDDPVNGGLIILSKDRWKNWVARGIYVSLIDILLIVLLFSLPKNSEINLIISYLLDGSSFIMAFWVFLCGVLLLRFQIVPGGVFFILISILFAEGAHFILMRIKKSDLSLTELKESFRKLNQTANEDPRLAPVTGLPGDWPNEDFVK